MSQQQTITKFVQLANQRLNTLKALTVKLPSDSETLHDDIDIAVDDVITVLELLAVKMADMDEKMGAS